MSSRKRRELEEQSYWPGYVDALTNVVLNLLFMVGIFAIGIFCMSMEAALRPLTPTVAQEEPETAEVAASQALGSPSASAAKPAETVERAPRPAVAAAAASARAAANASVPALPPLELRVVSTDSRSKLAAADIGQKLGFGAVEGRALTRILFGKSEFTITDENRKVIAGHMRAAEPGSHWTLWTTVDDRDGQDRREGYLRVMAVRSALLTMGVPPTDIDPRIFSGSHRGEADSRRVTLLVNAPQKPIQ